MSAIWPGSGLALGILLIGGKRYILGIFLGALLVNTLVNDSLWAVVGITLASILEAYLGVWLLTRNHQSAFYLHTLPDYLRLVLLGGCVVSIAGTIIGALSLLFTGFISTADYYETVLYWWMGDTLGIALVTPFILAFRQIKSHQLDTKQILEGLLLIGVTLFAGQIIFLDWLNESLVFVPKDFMMFFFITWVAIRAGICGVIFTVLIIAIQALWGASQEIGYFAYDISNTSLQNYWLYMLILSAVGMTVATYVNEIRLTLAALQLKDSALNATANGITITNINGRIERANQAFSRLSGYCLNEIQGRDHKELVKSGKQDKSYYQSM